MSVIDPVAAQTLASQSLGQNVVTPQVNAADAPAAVPTATTTTETLDYDAFLRLLVEQMKNQDPLEPISDTEYIAQLASFSNVEQNILTNERLLALLTSNTLSDAQSLIGRKVTAPDGTAGFVESIQIVANQIYATLRNGNVIVVGDGLKVE